MPIYVLGISAFYHDSAAALLVDGQIAAAAQEERFTRIKHDARFPFHAINYCLTQAGIALSDVDHIGFFEKPFLRFERLLETYLAYAPRGFRAFAKAMPVWLKEKLFQKSVLMDCLEQVQAGFSLKNPLQFSEHHYSHAASAFYPSGFDEALVLTLDGVGEWASTTAALGQGRHLQIIQELHFPHSIGLLYSAFTGYCGFKVNSGEYKLMGLAPYGKPIYADLIRRHLIDIKADGSFALDMQYFDYCTGLQMTSEKFHQLFGGPPRRAEELLGQREMDLAASIQAVTDALVLQLARGLQQQTGQKRLCLAGGVALNCVANGKLHASGLFDQIYVQPAAGDAGGALGAALAIWHGTLKQPRSAQPDSSYLGPEYSAAEIESALIAAGVRFRKLAPEQLISTCVHDLAAGFAIGWHQGRMEFGPRALGARSILADARSPQMQSKLNLKVKFRESFRPFAPIVLAEKASQWFDFEGQSPYMLMVAGVKAEHRKQPENPDAFGLDLLHQARSSIPAVTHVDYSARLQTLSLQQNPRLHALLCAFETLTQVPVLVNTSFNVRGEPMVCTPSDAIRCFLGTDLDRLAIGDFYLEKADQPEHLRMHYQDQFAPD
jgi:carbamoyltransferase